MQAAISQAHKDEITVEWQGRVPSDLDPNNSMDRTRIELKSMLIKQRVLVYPNQSGAILIHKPGFGENKEGYKFKYQTLAERVQQNLGAAILMGNQEVDYHNYHETHLGDLKAVIDYALSNAKKICGRNNPALYLMGFSAGASSVAGVAHLYPQVDRILLMGPTVAYGLDHETRAGIEQFTGKVFLAAGEHDRYKGLGIQVYRALTQAKEIEKVIVPDCDHYFRGATNDMIYSNAPFWAFTENTRVLSPENGIRLVKK